MNLFIPPLGTSLRLTADWTCAIHAELKGRTSDVRRALMAHAEGKDGAERLEGDWYARYSARNCAGCPLSLTLPEGTVLRVERIYIRQGSEDYDSVTFMITDCPDKRFVGKKGKGTFDGKPRFWVKLDDANEIRCEIVEGDR